MDHLRSVVFATTVNYLDRQVLSLLATDLSAEFGWTNSDYANITAVFQFVYAISLLFAGRFIDKLGTKAGYIWAIIIWSIGAIMHAFAVPLGNAANSVLAWVGIAAVPASIIGFMISRAVLAVGRQETFQPPSKQLLNIFQRKKDHLPLVFLIQVQMWVQFLRHSLFRISLNSGDGKWHSSS